MSQQRRRERYQIIYVWKILEGLSNSCPTANPIISYTNPRRGRSCFMPHMTRTRQFLTTIRHNNISALGPRLFNIIPKTSATSQTVAWNFSKESWMNSFSNSQIGHMSQDTPDSTTTACWMSSPHTKEHRVEPSAWPESLRPNKYKSTRVSHT